MNMLLANLLFLAVYLGVAPLPSEAISVSEIQGHSFLSPYEGQTLYDVYGVLVAKVCLRIYIRVSGRRSSHECAATDHVLTLRRKGCRLRVLPRRVGDILNEC